MYQTHCHLHIYLPPTTTSTPSAANAVHAAPAQFTVFESEFVIKNTFSLRPSAPIPLSVSGSRTNTHAGSRNIRLESTDLKTWCASTVTVYSDLDGVFGKLQRSRNGSNKGLRLLRCHIATWKVPWFRFYSCSYMPIPLCIREVPWGVRDAVLGYRRRAFWTAAAEPLQSGIDTLALRNL